MQVFRGRYKECKQFWLWKHYEPCSWPMDNVSYNPCIISCAFRLFSANKCYTGWNFHISPSSCEARFFFFISPLHFRILLSEGNENLSFGRYFLTSQLLSVTGFQKVTTNAIFNLGKLKTKVCHTQFERLDLVLIGKYLILLPLGKKTQVILKMGSGI